MAWVGAPPNPPRPGHSLFLHGQVILLAVACFVRSDDMPVTLEVFP